MNFAERLTTNAIGDTTGIFGCGTTHKQ